MECLSLKVKKLVPEAVLPTKAKADDAGYDCISLDNGTWNADKTYIEYRTGLAIEVPKGYHTELFPRSSISKYDLVLCNSVGLVDNGYRGELCFRFKYIPRLDVDLYIHYPNAIRADDESPERVLIPLIKVEDPILYKKGDKVGQIVIRKTYDFPVIEVPELSETERGTGGFGSSGK